MHLDLALLLSEAKGELRFYKSEVLKDVLYYNCGGRAADGSTTSRPLQDVRVHPGAFWKPGLRASVAAPLESAQHKRTAARVSPCGSLLLLQASLLQQGRNLRFPAQTHDMHTLAIGLALPDDTGGNLHAGNTGLGFFLIGL